MTNQTLTINPWLKLWVHPRQTIRAIINYRVTHYFLLLCFLNGIFAVFSLMQSTSLGTTYSSLTLIVVSLILALPFGYLHFNITAFVIFITGKLIKGRGTFKQIRAAQSWAIVPGLISALIFWSFWIGLKDHPFVMDNIDTFVLQFSNNSFLVSYVISSILIIWGCIIWLHMLGEVQQFSAWLSLLNIFLTILAFTVITVVLVGIIALSINRKGDHVQIQKTRSEEVVLATCHHFFP